MEIDRWRQLQDLFAAARAAEGDRRQQLLEQHARVDPELVEQVRSLLTADAQPGVMDVLAPHLPSITHVLNDPAPSRVGSYRVVSEIGRGGMGVVYLAERADGEFSQRVAIKLIATSNRDDPLHQRFLAERQILAGLSHPNIARLMDGGLTVDGHPYLVMEYVDGLPITTYCDEHRLDIPTRLRLFAEACAAVHHAHQNLVIHRDLKPANILVSTDGRVHLLDFGIAKLIEQSPLAPASPPTRVDARIMTPEYASPEQARGESLTTASDIYSLGVLLYELLCGRPPYQLESRSPLAVATAVCEQDPERPSARVRRADSPDGGSDPDVAARMRGTSPDRLARLLDGDLDGIVLMAMRKEPRRRYASADMLREDIERYQTAQPLLAHRGTRRYRIAKFFRRHRVEAIASALVFAALIIGLTVAMSQARRAARERDRAEQSLAESNAVTGFLLDLFQTGEPSDVSPGQLTALDLLQRGALRADELSNQPSVHARLLDVVGQMSFHLGRLAEAQSRLEQAVAIRRSAPTAAPADLASSLIHLAWVHRTLNNYDRARSLVTEALDIRRHSLPANDPDIAEALYELGWLMFGDSQERLYREALAALTDTPANAELRVRLLQALSTNLRRQGQLTAAVDSDRQALAIAERSFGPDHHSTGSAMIHLGDHIRDIEQDVAAAERLYRRGLDLLSLRFGENSVRLIHGLNSLATLLSTRASNEAELHFRRALDIRRSATGRYHPQVADQVHKLAAEIARQGRLAEAETLAREALNLSIQSVGPRHQSVTTARLPLLAHVLDLQKRHAEADQVYRGAFDQVQRPSNVMIGQMHRDYGLMLLRRRDLAGAERQLLESLVLLEKAYGGHHPNVQETKRALMELYRQLNQPDSVERYRVPPGRFVPH